MADIGVKPVREGMGLRHPLGFALPDEGGLWPDDQNTYRMIRDGAVERFDLPAEEPAAEPEKPSGLAGLVGSVFGGTKTPDPAPAAGQE